MFSCGVRSVGKGCDLCELGFTRDPGEEPISIDYENGLISLTLGDETTMLGSYERNPGIYGSRVFDYSSGSVIGLVGEGLIHFFYKEEDADAGRVLRGGKCLAYYTGSGRITSLDQLSTLGLIDGSEIGGAAAFVIDKRA